MVWSTTRDAGAFLAAAEPCLAHDPAACTVLLSEAAHLQARPSQAPDLLLGSFEVDRDLLAAAPDDPTDLAYLVDEPLSYDGALLWEVDGVPEGVATRSRCAAGMVRVGASYAPRDETFGRAAFAALCERSRDVADHVVVLGRADDVAGAAWYRGLGFEPVAERVLLQPGDRPRT